MANNFTKVLKSQEDSELFKKRLEFGLEQGYSESEAIKLANLKAKTDHFRHIASRKESKSASKNSSPAQSSTESQQFEMSKHPDLSLEAINREIDYQISVGKMSRIPSSFENSLGESTFRNFQAEEYRANPLAFEKSHQPESVVNAAIYILIYSLTVAVIVPATAEALGGGWMGWCSGIALDVSIGILFSMIFESTKNPMRFLWALLTAALIFVSYKNLEAGGGVASASKASVYVDQTPEVKTFSERVSRLKIDRDQIPVDQNTNRRRIGEQLTAAENSLLEARKIAAASPKVDAINSSARSSLYVWSALIFISMFSMYRIRACLSDPAILASLLGKG